MQLVERIEDQISATGLPLVGITLAAVPCPDTPVILTLHWHGFIKERIAALESAQAVSYTPVPSSALQLNDRWRDLLTVDCAAMEAAEFGVRINAVSPSLAMHEFLRKSAPQEFLEALEAKEAFGRGAECWEIANVIVFLASDYSSYMTGEVVSVSSQHA